MGQSCIIEGRMHHHIDFPHRKFQEIDNCTKRRRLYFFLQKYYI
jgi:hypothetical protein